MREILGSIDAVLCTAVCTCFDSAHGMNAKVIPHAFKFHIFIFIILISWNRVISKKIESYLKTFTKVDMVWSFIPFKASMTS
jgi:hypothetical protein